MDEIREYEQLLAQIREEIDAGTNINELKEAEKETVDLLAELRSKLPRFAPGDEVTTKKLRGKVVTVLASKMYEVQPYSDAYKPKGEPVSITESALRGAVFPKPDAVPKDIEVTKKNKELMQSDEFEASKSKWKRFSQKSKRGVKGGVTKQALGTKK